MRTLDALRHALSAMPCYAVLCCGVHWWRWQWQLVVNFAISQSSYAFRKSARIHAHLCASMHAFVWLLQCKVVCVRGSVLALPAGSSSSMNLSHRHTHTHALICRNFARWAWQQIFEQIAHTSCWRRHNEEITLNMKHYANYCLFYCVQQKWKAFVWNLPNAT